jgi:hypothetical protein
MSPSSTFSTSTGSMVTVLPLGITGSIEFPKARKRATMPCFTFHVASRNTVRAQSADSRFFV